MREKTILSVIIAASLLLASHVFSADYSEMNKSELARLRGSMVNATTQEKQAFQLAWQKRIAGEETGNINRNRTTSGMGEGNSYRENTSAQNNDCSMDRRRTRARTIDSDRSKEMDRTGQNANGQNSNR